MRGRGRFPWKFVDSAYQHWLNAALKSPKNKHSINRLFCSFTWNTQVKYFFQKVYAAAQQINGTNLSTKNHLSSSSKTASKNDTNGHKFVQSRFYLSARTKPDGKPTCLRRFRTHDWESLFAGKCFWAAPPRCRQTGTTSDKEKQWTGRRRRRRWWLLLTAACCTAKVTSAFRFLFHLAGRRGEPSDIEHTQNFDEEGSFQHYNTFIIGTANSKKELLENSHKQCPRIKNKQNY